ncbi:glutamine amidotransferase [Pseudomonas sp. NPDC087346]|uniref:glutamine amidotransferase n=1 Tax=Pseudomonas sp. NPDC087346 TaxID=3364438 RepID=UPI00382911CC
MSRLPLIGVTDCSVQSGLHAYHISGDSSVRIAADKACDLPQSLSHSAAKTATSDILDAQDGTLFTDFPSNIDRFLSRSLSRARRRVHCVAHDSARSAVCVESAREMQRQRKGQVSSSFIVFARCQA